MRNGTLEFDVDSLPVDVIELVDRGLEVESLTAGHGVAEDGATLRNRTSGCCNLCWKPKPNGDPFDPFIDPLS